MKRISFPLFTKYAAGITIIVVVFGFINILLLWQVSYKSYEREINKRILIISNIISNKVLDPILYDDFVKLYSILDGIKRSDTSIQYIFIRDKIGKVISQTYDYYLPDEVITANSLVSNNYNIDIFRLSKEFITIRDIAFPILDGELGTIRIGFLETDMRNELINASQKFIGMILIFLLIGLTGAFIFSHLISDPIKRISFFLQNVDFNSFNRKIDIKPQWYKKINNYYLYDEIDLLIDKFSEMYNRLKVNYNELQKTQNSLIHSEKLASIGTLSAGIAHEINNPLAGIQNCIKRMSKKPDDMEQQKQYLDLMTEAVDRISFVVNGLLDFSRKRDFKIEKIDISKVIDKALTLVQYNLDKSGISIVKEYPSDIPRVTGSENHLEQVLLNLLLNSIEAINALKLINKNIKGFIKIVLIDKNDHLWLWIEDNGIGIEEEKIKYIFDPFFTNKKEGTGLGLAISYKIINDHDGSIKAIKNNFGGLTFLIELPKSKID